MRAESSGLDFLSPSQTLSTWGYIPELPSHLPHSFFLGTQLGRIKMHYCFCPMVCVPRASPVHQHPGGPPVLKSSCLASTTSSGTQRGTAGARLGSEKYLEMKSIFILLFLLPHATIASFIWICIRANRIHSNFNLFFLFCPSITRTFASGKTEKVIFQALKELGLPSGKVFIHLITYFYLFIFIF